VGAIIKKRPKLFRILACSLIAALISTLSFSIPFTISLGYQWTYFVVFLPPFFFISAMVMIVLGFPLLCLGLKFHLVKWWSALIAGFIVGDLLIVMFSWPRMPFLVGFFSMGTIGAVSAFGFWLTWTFLDRRDL